MMVIHLKFENGPKKYLLNLCVICCLQTHIYIPQGIPLFSPLHHSSLMVIANHRHATKQNQKVIKESLPSNFMI